MIRGRPFSVKLRSSWPVQAKAGFIILTQHHSLAKTLAASRMMMCQQADIHGKQVLTLSSAVQTLGLHGSCHKPGSWT